MLNQGEIMELMPTVLDISSDRVYYICVNYVSATGSADSSPDVGPPNINIHRPLYK